VGELTVDPSTRAVRLAGRRWSWPAKEFALLHALAEEPTHVYGKNELLATCGASRASGRTRTLDAHACRLRKKLKPVVATVGRERSRVGYKLTGGGVTSARDPELVARRSTSCAGRPRAGLGV
jgi:DNA-binding response OmpR family regulator